MLTVLSPCSTPQGQLWRTLTFSEPLQRRIINSCVYDVGDSESGAFWTAFLLSLKAHGLHGVQLVVSDAHTGLKSAVSSILLGASWQRCRIHFGRNLLAAVPAGHGDMVAAVSEAPHLVP